MSNQEDVSTIVESAVGSSDKLEPARECIARAFREVSGLMEATSDSVYDMCLQMESATTEEVLRKALRRFSPIMRIFLESAPKESHDPLLREALKNIRLSDRFNAALGVAPTVESAVRAYKLGVVQELAASVRRQELQSRFVDQKDDELLSRFFPPPAVPVPAVQGILSDADLIPVALAGCPPSGKRGISQIADATPVAKIPRRSQVPALASLERLQGSDVGSSKKQALMTREKLRAGLHDARGLLDLAGPSTHALERTKKLELLKSAGFLSKIQGASSSSDKRSFSDKLVAAALRLDLGVGGHKVADTLLFGAKVLSSPGFLSPKNITEVENNFVDGNTTWKHQDAYCKMLIAGCLNQARRILEKYDDILYGPSPEKLIEMTHSSIRDLLTSDRCQTFLKRVGDPDQASVDSCDQFVKNIVEAVSPIIPISLRNKTLDGGYLRTALHFLGAAEFLFAQYFPDTRQQANPAGAVGMSTAMHAEFHRSAIYNEELKPLRDFMKEMKAQYQTSLGLGTPFNKDSGSRAKRRGQAGRRGGRGRGFSSGYQQPFFGAGNYLNSAGVPGVTQPVASNGRGVAGPMRGRLCYDFQAGRCNRGRGCRFLHPTS